MKGKRVFFWGLYFAAVGSLVTVSATDQFVLPKQTHKNKKLSRNELKESIGQEVRDAFNVSTNINKQSGLFQITVGNIEEALYKKNNTISFDNAYQNIVPLQKSFGALHVELAEIQQKFSRVIERLVDNQKPFKKASRDTLDGALRVLQEIKQGLKGYEGQFALVSHRLTKISDENINESLAVLVNLKKTTRCAVDEIKKGVTRMNSCEGLKIS